MFEPRSDDERDERDERDDDRPHLHEPEPRAEVRDGTLRIELVGGGKRDCGNREMLKGLEELFERHFDRDRSDRAIVGPGVYCPEPGCYEFGRKPTSANLPNQVFFAPSRDGIYEMGCGIVAKTVGTYTETATLTYPGVSGPQSFTAVTSMSGPGSYTLAGTNVSGFYVLIPANSPVQISTSGSDGSASTYEPFFWAKKMCEVRQPRDEEDE